MNTALIRQVNLARVFHALREHPDSSQRELAAVTGLDKATVSAVVAQLEAQGLIIRTPRHGNGRVGRPEVPLRLSPQAGLFVGVRLEPATIRLLATELDGRIIERLQVAGCREVGSAISRLEQAVAELLTRCGRSMAEVRGIGVGVPGLMDKGGNLVLAPNLGWRNEPILQLLRERFSAPVYVDNDTKAAALAEKLFGLARDADDFLVIAGHSGIGGALFLNGALYRGASGVAGEIGHLEVVAGGRRCGCGKRGCLEAYTSENAILSRLAEAGRALPDLSAVAEAAGDPVVRQVLDETGDYLGVAVANLINTLNPALVILGGNLAWVAQYLLPRIELAMARVALDAPRASVRLVVSPLGIEQVPMGGVALALDGFVSLPGRFPELSVGRLR